MAGLPLNHELSSRGARFVAATRTANRYRLYALAGGPPRRPGMVQVAADGAALELELWDLPLAAVGSFMAGIPAPLGIGTVQLANGERVKGFLCEMAALDGAEDITHFGGWRSFLNV
jgi:allophanate hydrolase